ncbi:MAG: sigma-70 family RNA polymerase sigma factor [Acidobacteria bacterium]|nr:sigma-70 family RNA polymerase sigma factor [Acidobacteriota bacterium]MBI3426234.1 sigma-70 family RNA polymerase sigma factor [Acidobacteriota bacterium]
MDNENTFNSNEKEVSDERAAMKRRELSNLAARLLTSPLEEAAYRDFTRYFGPRLKALFRYRDLSETEAEDLAETCLTDILTLKISKYSEIETGSFEAWVFTVARNALTDWLTSRPSTIPLPESTPNPLGRKLLRRIPKAVPDVKIITAISAALAQLPEADRQLIQLRDFIADNTYEEVGLALGIKANATRQRHYRILKRLRKMLERDPRLGDWLKRVNARTGKDV